MLINFTVGNYRSFKENKTFSLNATSFQEHKEFIREGNDIKFLPVVAIYGANSSGKSNLLSALQMMKNTLLFSIKTNPTEKLKTDPFLLDEQNKHKPTFFEVVFLSEGNTYKYGFEYSKDKINAEWLYTIKNEREKLLFIRNDNGIGVVSKDFPEGVDKESSTADNRLFLSLVAQLNGKISLAVMNWFEKLKYFSGITDSEFKIYSCNYLFENNENSLKAKDFIKSMDLGFTDIQKAETDVKDYAFSGINPEMKETIEQEIPNFWDKLLPPKWNETNIPIFKTGHLFRKSDGTVTEVFFRNDKMESEGTKKIINISGPIVEALSKGETFVIDELDAKLHPLLTKKIIEIFNSPDTNPNNAQLIFATHDTNLLSNKILRRDQIWFAEKNRDDESTDIYPLSEIKEQNGEKIRNDRVYEKDYINGKYGAIPYLKG